MNPPTNMKRKTRSRAPPHTRTEYTGIVDSTEHGSQLRFADFEEIELLHKAKGLAWHGKTSTAI